MAGVDWNVTISAPWTVQMQAAPGGEGVELHVAPPELVSVEDEQCPPLPLFDPRAAGWKRGQRLFRLQSQETSVKGGLEPGSLVVGATDGSATFARGTDYEVDEEWATVGRLEGGRIAPDQPVQVGYRYGLSRIDSIIVTGGGGVELRHGAPHVCTPRPLDIDASDRRIANVWVPGRLTALTADHLFPVLETAYPEPPRPSREEAERRLPQTLAKLRDGSPLHVLAWGDSVTDASYLRDRTDARWQERFVRQLQEAFPGSAIRLTTAGWGGRRSRSFVDEPDGSEHSYKTAVLNLGPDLVVSEFVNDAGLDAAGVEEQYGGYLRDFRRIGAEWIILTPHYVRPDFMGIVRERDVDQDPRPYVAALHAFAATHGVPLADASRRWGRLWRQGIPYTTLLLNAINHPDERGMQMFADALMALFPAAG